MCDYAVSQDGSKLTLNVATASPMGFIRKYKDEGGGIKPHCLTFYSTFGGLNSSLGAENSFVLEIAQGVLRFISAREMADINWY